MEAVVLVNLHTPGEPLAVRWERGAPGGSISEAWWAEKKENKDSVPKNLKGGIVNIETMYKYSRKYEEVFDISFQTLL